MSKLFICIHGHFYQPPRENPWLEEIEVQDSAYPYRDWNERINAECYNPNTASRILGDNKNVIDIVNNYSRISFNFGPTLLSWLEEQAADVYAKILEADKLSSVKFSGHGSAIAQIYNHLIMPLANDRDKRTQIIWGIEDFRERFEREPEGMWLSETAVNLRTLELLAEYGIKFTILAPSQAKSIKRFDEEEWNDVSKGTIDPKRAYLCRLPSGNSINLFFYDGPISQELAFGNLLDNGSNLFNRLVETFRSDDEIQLAHIATDGETYGHHQRHGDMALAYFLNLVEERGDVELTNYGEFLEKSPPEWEVQIIENTSWSCIHGIERWKSDCGCNSGMHSEWNQKWRQPLRECLDWLRDRMIGIYEGEAAKYFTDVWKLRDNYIKIILQRSPENIRAVLAENGIKNISDGEMIRLLKLLELQRHSMLMYTSCGWFFDEISGLETVQVIQYAARAIQLANELTGINPEDEFIDKLRSAPSNISEIGNGAEVYRKNVKPAIVDLLRVAAHYAISSLFENYGEQSEIFCYEINKNEYEMIEAGRNRLAIGNPIMRSKITLEEKQLMFAVLYLGDHNIYGGVSNWQNDEEFRNMHDEIKNVFSRMDIAEMILSMDSHFGTHSYSLWHLFKDKSREVFDKILHETLESIEMTFRNVFKNHYAIMQAMKRTNNPLPKALSTAIGYVINADLKNIFENPETIDQIKLQNLLHEVRYWLVELDKSTLSYVGSQRLVSLMKIFEENPGEVMIIDEIINSLRILKELSIELDVWKAQNILFSIVSNRYKKYENIAKSGDKKSAEWIDKINELQEKLEVNIRIAKVADINLQAAV
ncbi:MAG TPA: DUF3536 domain-containing protein [Ignavibacteriaceae bacterium]|nr:DUF3536 domain-containing protein [Ignavibacteriaceae bacterium]